VCKACRRCAADLWPDPGLPSFLKFSSVFLLQMSDHQNCRLPCCCTTNKWPHALKVCRHPYCCTKNKRLHDFENCRHLCCCTWPSLGLTSIGSFSCLSWLHTAWRLSSSFLQSCKWTRVPVRRIWHGLCLVRHVYAQPLALSIIYRFKNGSFS